MTEPKGGTLGAIARDFKAGVLVGLDQQAHEHGTTRAGIIGDVAAALIASRLMWKAARRGDVAHTVAWGVVSLRTHAAGVSRRSRVQLERQMDVLIDRETR